VIENEKAHKNLTTEHFLQAPVGHRSKNNGSLWGLVWIELHIFLESAFDIVNRIKDLEHVLVFDNLKVLKYCFSSEENLDVLQLLAYEALLDVNFL
jgi:hypothetical protein